MRCYGFYGGLLRLWVSVARFIRKICGIAGIGLSVYLFDLKLLGGLPYCPATGFVNCSSVLHSAYSLFLGIPVPFFGIFWFLLLYVLPTRSGIPWLDIFWRAVVISGGLFVGYLVSVEFFLIHHLCLWCSATHVVALMGVISYFYERRRPTKNIWASRYDLP